jgi:LEA14-like dessication related protein
VNRRRFLAAGLSAASLLVGACASLTGRPQPPRVSLIGLSLVSVGLFEQRYQVRLRLKNPNDFELPVRGMDFRLDINGEAFAEGLSNQSVTVPAFSEEVVELEVSSSLLQVFRQLQSLQQSGAPGLAYRVSGHVAVGSYARRLPFDYSGEFALPADRAAPPDKGV